MEKNLITYSTFSIPAVEQKIQELQTELQDFAHTQGRQDGQKEQEITEGQFQIKVIDFIKAKGQTVIDCIKQTVLIGSQVLHVKEQEQAVAKSCAETQINIDEKEHQLVALKRTKKSLIPDPFFTKYAALLLPLAIVIGIADGALAYAGFRGSAYSTIQAFIASAAITLVIATSHLLYTNWIMASKKRSHRILKIGTVLGLAFIFFYFISTIRASGINNAVSIAVPGSSDQSDTAPHISQWAVCGISFVLFAVVLFFSLLLWRSKEDRLKIMLYHTISKEIIQVTNEIKALEQHIADTTQRIIILKRDARIAYDYVAKSIQRTKNSCDGAIAVYKQQYVRFHTCVPPFLTDAPELQYDENLQLFEPVKQDA